MSSTAPSPSTAEASTAGAASASADANRQRQSNLIRIQQRKQAVRAWPLEKKLEKLSIYSSCKSDADCKCNGEFKLSISCSLIFFFTLTVHFEEKKIICLHWTAFNNHITGWKNPNPPPNPPRPDAPNPTASAQDPCRTCTHPLSDHVSHLQQPVRFWWSHFSLFEHCEKNGFDLYVADPTKNFILRLSNFAVKLAYL